MRSAYIPTTRIEPHIKEALDRAGEQLRRKQADLIRFALEHYLFGSNANVPLPDLVDGNNAPPHDPR